jgi:hypothetical protein
MRRILSNESDVLPIEEQINRIGEIFNLDPNPALTFAKKLHLPSLTCDADGWFAIPKESSLFPSVRDVRLRHCFAVSLVRQLLSKNRNFLEYTKYRALEFTPGNFLITRKTSASMSVTGAEQVGDIVIIPASFVLPDEEEEADLSEFRRLFGNAEVYLNGELLYSSGCDMGSLSRNLFSKFGFHLDMFSFGCILLTHLELVKQWTYYESFQINCLGSRFDHLGKGTFEKVPMFNFVDDVVCLTLTDAHPSKDSVDTDFSSICLATGFIGAHI